MDTLTIAIRESGLTRALKDGSVPSDRVTLEQVEVSPITAAFRRMVRGLEFDVCEMAISTYLCAKAHGKPITAIPVFITRAFHHSAVVCRVDSQIKTPKDLEGRRVGVNRGYTVTTGVWARGILQREYGVNLDKITWLPTDDEHVAEYRAPPNVDYSSRGKTITELLQSGTVDAAVGDIPIGSPAIRTLVPDARDAGFAYFRRTGVYPINHGVVIKNAVLDANPKLAEELFNMFNAAKKKYLDRLDAGGNLSAADESAISIGRVVGDPYPFGIGANRKALETIIQFSVDQQVIPRPFTPEELFAPGTVSLE